MLLNQWANVVRWELRPRAFLRTTEFLWQEGHTAHATEQEAREETMRMLKVYSDFMHEMAAVPVIPGVKTEKERFAGAVDTYTIEAMMGNGWALQGGTSHYLGTNFARVFETTFLDRDNQRQFVHQSSWGVSTRLVGAVIMAHGDANGLRLPPRIAPVQAVIIPIGMQDPRASQVMEACDALAKELQSMGVRASVDSRDNMSPGFKFNHWEVRGVPLRIEIGPRDLDAGHATLAQRNRKEKFTLPLAELTGKVPALLNDIHDQMLREAADFRESRTFDVDTFEEFKRLIPEKPGFYRVWWDGSREDENRIQEETSATVRCIPLEQPGGEGKCFMSGRRTSTRAILARAY